MDWWLWMVGGFGLLALELFLSTGFYLFIFGLSALVMGLIGLLGISLSSNMQYVVYAVITVVLLLGVRKQIVKQLFAGSKNISDELTGKDVILNEDLAPGALGSGEMRGTVWKVKNVSQTNFKKGERGKVEKIDGLTLHLNKVS